MRMSSRAALAAIVLGFTALAGAAAQERALQKVQLAIGYIPHVQFTPLYVGIAKGFYRDEGIDLQLHFGFEYDVFSLLAAGKIDVGLTDSDQLILAGAKNIGLKAIFQYYQKYPVTIIARADTVKVPADLKGKRIGTPDLSGASWIGLQIFLHAYGLEGAVSVEKIGYTQEATLRGGKADAVVCFFNNEPIQLRSEHVPFREWDVKDISDMVSASFISSDSIIKTRGEVLAAFVRATRKAMAYTMDHRDEAFQIALRAVGNVPTRDEPLFRQRLDATCELFASPKGYGYMDLDQYNRSIAELVSLGLIPSVYPAERIVKVF
ncbi:MAG TPA: ABC transporter substrate-binding protein [Spirochaetia bacterium]|nr:ABC transporter substrate-binding protein [Spirochaetia bacterium]